MTISRQTRALIRQSLREDIGCGDLTTSSLIPKHLQGEAFIDAKANGILCGGEVVGEVFRTVDSKLKVRQKVSDGTAVSKGKKAFYISGKIFSILKSERVALNFLSHLSGIATVTNRYVQKIKGTRARIYDTRKTTPLWRELEKKAVKTGGGQNHRFGLWDEILVKDNHWAVLLSLRGGRKSVVIPARFKRPPALRAEGLGEESMDPRLKYLGMTDCFASLRAFRPEGPEALAMTKNKIPIEIEVANLRQLNDLLRGDFIPDRILLDNFSVLDLKRAVAIVRRQKRKIVLEASGGITLKNVRRVSKTGVDRISVGALTHSAPALDFSLTVSNVVTK